MSGKSNHKNREKFHSSKPQLPDFVEFSVSDAELSALESAPPLSQAGLEMPAAVAPTEIRDDLTEEPEPDVDPGADFLKFVKNLWRGTAVVFWRTVAVLRAVSRFCLNGAVVSFTFLKSRTFSLLSRLRKSESPDFSEEEIEGKIEGLRDEIPLPALRQENGEEEEVSGEEDFDEEAYENAIRSIRFKIVATAALIFLSIGGLIGYRYYAHAKKNAAILAENKPLTESLSETLAKKESPSKSPDRLAEPPLSKPVEANPAYTSAVGSTSTNEKQSPPAVSLVPETEAGTLEQSLENPLDSLEPLIGTQSVDSFAANDPPMISDPYGTEAVPELDVAGIESNVPDPFSNVVAGNPGIASLTNDFSHETVSTPASVSALAPVSASAPGLLSASGSTGTETGTSVSTTPVSTTAVSTGSEPLKNTSDRSSFSGTSVPLTTEQTSPLTSRTLAEAAPAVSPMREPVAVVANSISATSTALTQQPLQQSQQLQPQQSLQQQSQQSRQLQPQSQPSTQQPQQQQVASVRQQNEPQAVLTQPRPKYADQKTEPTSRENTTAIGSTASKERPTAKGSATSKGNAKLTRAPLFSPTATSSSPQETFVAEAPGPVGISASPLTGRSTPTQRSTSTELSTPPVVTSLISDSSPTARPVATLDSNRSSLPTQTRDQIDESADLQREKLFSPGRQVLSPGQQALSLDSGGKKAEPFRPGSRKARPEVSIDISPGTVASSQELVYTVQEGDNLFNIAKNELGDVRGWQELYRLNEDVLGDDAEYLKPGLELKLPSREALDFPQERR